MGVYDLGVYVIPLHHSHCELTHQSPRYGMISLKPRHLSVILAAPCLLFRIKRPILGDDSKPHKFACSGRLPSSVTEGLEMMSCLATNVHKLCVFQQGYLKDLSGTRLRISRKVALFERPVTRNCNPIFTLFKIIA